MNISEQITELKSRFESAETLEEAKSIKSEIDSLTEVVAEGKSAINALDAMKVEEPVAEAKCAATVGEHAAAEFKGVDFSGHMASTEFKAATTVATAPTISDYDWHLPVAPAGQRVADLFSQQTASGNSISYFVQSAPEGGFAVVAQNGLKPQMHIDYTPKTAPLDKIAGIYKESDELLADAPRLAAAIDGRGMNMLRAYEDSYVMGKIAAVSGLGTETATAATLMNKVLDAITAVQTASGFAADAVIMNPSTWSSLLQTKDSTGQYVSINPYAQNGKTLWGVPVFLTSACPAAKVYVGAFKQFADFYRKGGVMVDVANQHDEDFAYNRITVRVEERVALAAVMPAAAIEITVS